MAMMKCTECGNPVSTTASNCPKCGAKVVVRPTYFSEFSRRKKVAVLLLACFIGYLGYRVVSAVQDGQHISSVTAEASEAPAKGWRYSTTPKDAMTGTRKDEAALVSDTTLQFEFPYNGGSIPELTLFRTQGKTDYSVMLAISKGQIVGCITKCTVQVKFDDGPVEQYWAEGGHTGDMKYVFLYNEKRFIERLRHSRKVIIEANFYEHPMEQMTFSTAGLKW